MPDALFWPLLSLIVGFLLLVVSGRWPQIRVYGLVLFAAGVGVTLAVLAGVAPRPR